MLISHDRNPLIYSVVQALPTKRFLISHTQTTPRFADTHAQRHTGKTYGQEKKKKDGLGAWLQQGLCVSVCVIVFVCPDVCVITDYRLTDLQFAPVSK